MPGPRRRGGIGPRPSGAGTRPWPATRIRRMRSEAGSTRWPRPGGSTGPSATASPPSLDFRTSRSCGPVMPGWRRAVETGRRLSSAGTSSSASSPAIRESITASKRRSRRRRVRRDGTPSICLLPGCPGRLWFADEGPQESNGATPSTGRRVTAGVPDSVDAALALLAAERYVAERSLATTVFLALKLGRPLFLEGEAGVGKTEIAKVLAAGLGRRMERLQCYEGLDVASAVYEWNYLRQMIDIRLAEAAGGVDRTALAKDVFSAPYLIKRPLLRALEPDAAGAPVLLIDELDRADEPFEAYLLEILSDFQITIPEIGRIAAPQPPIVIITSNRTREIHDALKRRCFYHWVDYPDAVRERAILHTKVPRIGEVLSRQIVAFVQELRKRDLFKLPGIAETLDWANALIELDAVELEPGAVDGTLGMLLKYQDDILRMRQGEAALLLEEVRGAVRAEAARSGRPHTPGAASL